MNLEDFVHDIILLNRIKNYEYNIFIFEDNLNIGNIINNKVLCKLFKNKSVNFVIIRWNMKNRDYKRNCIINKYLNSNIIKNLNICN